MKIARVEYKGGVFYARMQEDRARLIEGDIFGEWAFSGEPVPLSEAKLLAPVRPIQVIAIGLNYRKHAEESGGPIPAEPLIFLKGVNAVTGPGAEIILPETAPDEVDYECELVIVIGKKAKNVPEENAPDYILGYTCGNDVSARDCQLKRDKQWARGKSFDTFAPLGPWIETDIDPGALDIKTVLNGKVMQQSSTSDLIFSCNELVSYVSKSMTIYPGSVIMTGTPAGVGFARKPQVFLSAGDEVSVEIEGIGILSNRVVKEDGAVS